MQREDREFVWQIDRFGDTKVLRYRVPGFEALHLGQKILIYHLGQAALAGRDILFDQNFRYNLDIRRVLEAIYISFDGDRSSGDFLALELYLKKVWFANGIHHHYSGDKFKATFSRSFFEGIVEATSSLKGERELTDRVGEIIFCDELYPTRLCQSEGVDMVLASSNNYYRGVTQVEAEEFYAKMAESGDAERPISYGLNSRLERVGDELKEVVWRVGGEYSAALERVVDSLESAAAVASDVQKEMIESLISYYRSGDLAEFDRFNVLWVGDTESSIDFVNGFIEVYGDALGYKASWEGIVNFKNEEATKRTDKISGAAQWFEDNSPIDERYKKPEVRGVSAKVITVAMLGGDCYPATPIGINLPNADWIRKEHGSKSVTIENITDAYAAASASDSRYGREFYPSDVERALIKEHGAVAGNLHTDLHECLGHGSGQLAEGTRGDELKNYGSPLEEARADLFALYYMGSEKLIELGVMESMDVMRAEYYNYLYSGLIGQLTRIELGKDIVQAHMRCRKLISEWVLEKSRGDRAVELIKRDGKSFVVVNDYQRLRERFGELLAIVQRIKSEGDFASGAALVERYGVKIDQELHSEVLARYGQLDMAPYSGFVNPRMCPVVDEVGNIVDIEISYNDSYVEQMLEYSSRYSYL